MKKFMTATLTAIMVCSVPMTAMAATRYLPMGSNSGNILSALKNNKNCQSVFSNVYSGSSLKDICEKFNISFDKNCDLDSIINDNGAVTLPSFGGQPVDPGNNDNTNDNDKEDNDNNNDSDTDVSVNQFASEVAKLVNEERAKAGLEPLSIDTKVQQAAQIRAEEITRSFSHTRPDGSTFSTALKETGASYRGAGENIAYGQQTPEAVMNAWMNSDGHRRNILKENYENIGIGYVESNGSKYWVQVFTY